jgi:LysM repeat protein
VFYIEEVSDHLSCSGPYYSFGYKKNHAYPPMFDLEHDLFNFYEEVIFLANNADKIRCLKSFELVKVISDASPEGSFCMVADEDFVKLTEAQLKEASHDAFYVTYVEEIGIIEETTKRGKIILVSIDDIPLDDYLKYYCEDPVYLATLSPTMAPHREVPAEYENTTKGGGVTSKTSSSSTVSSYSSTSTTSTTSTTVSTSTVAGAPDFIILFEKAPYEKPIPTSYSTTTSKPQATPKGNAKIHIVDNGETLYGIARKYNISVDKLRQWNNLQTGELFVTQQLIISQ